MITRAARHPQYGRKRRESRRPARAAHGPHRRL